MIQDKILLSLHLFEPLLLQARISHRKLSAVLMENKIVYKKSKAAYQDAKNKFQNFKI